MIFLLNFVPALILAVYFKSRRQLDPFEPVVIAMSYRALSTALSGLGLWADSSTYTDIDYYLKSIGLSTSSYVTAAVLEITAFLAFLLGYSLCPMNVVLRFGKHRSTPISFTRGRTVPLLIFTLAVIGAIGLHNLIVTFNIDVSLLSSISKKRFISNGEGEISGAEGYSRWLASFSEYAALLFFAYMYSRKRRLNAIQTGIGIVLVALMVLPPFLTSSRAPLFFSILSFIVVLHYLRKPFNLRTLVIAGAIGLVLIALLGELRSFRGGADQPIGRRTSPGPLVNARTQAIY